MSPSPCACASCCPVASRSAPNRRSHLGKRWPARRLPGPNRSGLVGHGPGPARAVLGHRVGCCAGHALPVRHAPGGQVPVATGTGEGSAWGTLTAAQVGAIPASAEGAANGVATLDGNGIVPASELPNFPWLPSDNNLVAALGDPQLYQFGAGLTAGRVYLTQLQIREACEVAYLWWLVSSTAGSGTSSGTYTGLYSSSGSLLTGSADISSSLTSVNTPVKLPLTTEPGALSGRRCWSTSLPRSQGCRAQAAATSS